MQYSAQQIEAIAAFTAWWRGGSPAKQVFRLFGLAGTGKTTLARTLIDTAGTVAVCAFTGKAASVLRRKGLHATTVHRLIYSRPEKAGRPGIDSLVSMAEALGVELIVDGDVVRMRMGDPDREQPEKLLTQLGERRDELLEFLRERDGRHRMKPDEKTDDVEIVRKVKEKPRLEWVLRHPSDITDHVRLIVLDECSMIGSGLWSDLRSFGVPILALGDPAQLPPVGDGLSPVIGRGEADADVMLTEIMRQSADCGIPYLAREIRNGGDWAGFGTDLQGVRMARWPRDEWLVNHDQVICGTNNSRNRYNAKIRQYLGYSHTDAGLPKRGEKLICLRNNMEIGPRRSPGIMNGQQFEVLDARMGALGLIDLVLVEWQTDGAEPFPVVASNIPFNSGEVDSSTARNLGQFTWGYAITAHKSQGSEWDSVLVIDEGKIFGKDAAKWLYTAVTRARQELTLCTGGPISTPVFSSDDAIA